MSQERILVIEDEDEILELVCYNLRKDGFKVVGAASGEEGLEAVKSGRTDLVILDLMLPGMNGLEVCRLMKVDPRLLHIPIIMLTAKGEEPDVVAGLELGADDYIIKPFSLRVLLARVRAVLRRRTREQTESGDSILLHDLVIHPGRHEVLLKGKSIDLTFSEFQILLALAQRPGWVFTRNQLVDFIRSDEYAVTSRTIDVHIAGLRKKLGSAKGSIETIRGVGYRFKE